MNMLSVPVASINFMNLAICKLKVLRVEYASFFLTAVIIAVYGEPTKPEMAASVVESLGDYLTKCGY